MSAFNFFIIAAIAYLVSGEEKEELQSPSLESRVHLHSFYSSLPLSKDIELFVEYSPILPVTQFDGKVVEFDSMRWMNDRQTIHHKLPYLISNPALRTPHISAKWCRSTDFFKLGFRIHQVYREFGLPYQAKCATCHPIIEGLNTMYFLYPERDFTQSITKLSIETRKVADSEDYCTQADCEQEPRVTNFQDYLRVNDLFFGEWSRWNGEHGTTDGDRDMIGRPNGELSIHARTSDGFTTMCGMELDGKVVSSNVFVNGDVITDTINPDPSFSYDSYETLTVTVPSHKDVGLNLELIVSWDDWGCCSACCCPPAICGHDFQTSSDCDNVFSARSRTGYLSIRKVSKLPIVLKQYSGELSKLLSTPPYTHKGIPIFSSLLTRKELKFAMKEVTDTLIPPFLTANNASTYVFRTGMFIESESCKLHEQKTDCSKWAQCHNVSLSEINTEESEMATDSCQQVQFVDVLVGVDPMKVRVGEHDNLRIRMDPEVHDMNKTAATWRVNLRKPKKYEKSRPCILQGIVQRNNEILILDFSSFGLKVDLILNAKQKVRIVFVNTRKQEDSQKMNYSILYWAAAIVVFFLLLITAVVLMHREKTRRLESRIKARELHT